MRDCWCARPVKCERRAARYAPPTECTDPVSRERRLMRRRPRGVRSAWVGAAEALHGPCRLGKASPSREPPQRRGWPGQEPLRRRAALRPGPPPRHLTSTTATLQCAQKDGKLALRPEEPTAPSKSEAASSAAAPQQRSAKPAMLARAARHQRRPCSASVIH